MFKRIVSLGLRTIEAKFIAFLGSKCSYELFPQFRWSIVYSSRRTKIMETTDSYLSTNLTDKPSRGTQCDFTSKEPSFFVMKKCYSDYESGQDSEGDDPPRKKKKNKGTYFPKSIESVKSVKIREKNNGQDEIIVQVRSDENYEESNNVEKIIETEIELKGESCGSVTCSNETTQSQTNLANTCNNPEPSTPVTSEINDDRAESDCLDPSEEVIQKLLTDQPSEIKVAEKEVCLVGGKQFPEKRKVTDDADHINRELKKAKLETKALKAKRPGFTDERYNETSYYMENGLRKVYPYYFTFTTFTKGRWVGERILDVFAREFRAHPPQEYERCIKSGTLTVNYEKVDVDYRLKHNDLLANIVHRHEVPVSSQQITIVHLDEDVVVVNKPASIPVHPCGRYRHNTVVFILAKEYQLKNLRTIHRLDRLTSGLLLFGRTPKKARQMEQQIRNRMVHKEYVCRVDGHFPSEVVHCSEPIEVVSYKIGVCKVSPKGKECTTTFHKLGYNPDTNTSVVLCKPHTGRMHQIRVHLQFLGYPVVNDPLYNHEVFGPERGRGGNIGKSDEQLIRDLISIHNAENWLGMDGDNDSADLLAPPASPLHDDFIHINKGGSRETSPYEGESSPLPPSPPSAAPGHKVTVATQTGHEAPDLSFDIDKMTQDPHCYECKVRYRDPRPRDLVMYLHAFKYQGPGWCYQTELPDWARVDWVDPGD